MRTITKCSRSFEFIIRRTLYWPLPSPFALFPRVSLWYLCFRILRWKFQFACCAVIYFRVVTETALVTLEIDYSRTSYMLRHLSAIFVHTMRPYNYKGLAVSKVDGLLCVYYVAPIVWHCFKCIHLGCESMEKREFFCNFRRHGTWRGDETRRLQCLTYPIGYLYSMT